jgi:F0F1-type ATP synthase membrane subunit b/b'
MKSRAFALSACTILVPAASWCAEGGGEAATGGSWLSLVFYVINFALFVAILVWADRYYGRPTHRYFAGRARSIKETFARAEASCREAEELARRAGERMARLDEDKKKLREDLDAETAYIMDRIRQMGREAAARIKRDYEMTAAAMAESAQRRVREQLAEATGHLARNLVAMNFSPNDQARLLQSFEQKLQREASR